MSKQKKPPFSSQDKGFLWSLPHNPNEINFSFDFKGAIKKDLFRRALSDTLMQYPLFRTKIRQGRIFIRRKTQKIKEDDLDNSLVFKEIGPGEDPISWTARETNTFFAEIALDYHKNYPFVIWILEASPHDWTLLLKLQHSCCDAYGGVIFLSHVVQRYNSIQNKENGLVLPPEPKQYGFGQLGKQFSAKELREKRKEKNPDLSLVHFKEDLDGFKSKKRQSMVIGPDAFTKLQGLCGTMKITLNSLFTALIMLALKKTAETGRGLKDWLVLEQIANIRKNLGIQGGISNYLAAFYTLQSTGDMPGLEGLAASLDSQIKSVLSGREYLKELFLYPLVKYFPTKWVKRLYFKMLDKMLQKPPLSSALSNLGKLDALLELPADNILRSLSFVPTPNILAGHMWTVVSYRNLCSITLGYYTPMLSENIATNLLRNFQTELNLILEKN